MHDSNHTLDHHFLKIKVSTSLPQNNEIAQSLFCDDPVEEIEEIPIKFAPSNPVVPIFQEEEK